MKHTLPIFLMFWTKFLSVERRGRKRRAVHRTEPYQFTNTGAIGAIASLVSSACIPKSRVQSDVDLVVAKIFED